VSLRSTLLLVRLVQSRLWSLCGEEDATRSVHRGGASVPLLLLLHYLAAAALDAGIWVSVRR